MKNPVKSAIIAGLMLGAASAPAWAQNPISVPAIPGIAVADLDAAASRSNAFMVAQQQRQVTYKPQLDSYEARRAAIAAQLQPLMDKFNRDRQAAAPNQAVLQQQAQEIQRIETAGQQELQRIAQPVAYSDNYVQEQIAAKLNQAVVNAMNKRKISLLLSPEAVQARSEAYNLEAAIADELNVLVPTVQLVPPPGWEPRQIREARAQQAAQQGQPAAPVQPAGPQPQGR